ncbi:hypothetical protein M885DRAFT_536735 [Pelagophyceae sp. CCMP2097]|nr:hypothetical protein M885DRAFT_536735 [Pelagophyceae sp. CCMP2097]
MQGGSRLSPIDATDDCQGPAIGMTYLPPDICMTMGDVAPIICDDLADDDGPLSGFSVSLFAEEALDSLRDDARHAQARNTFSLDKVTCPDDDGPWGFPPDEIFEERMPVMPLQRLPTPPQRAPAVSAPRPELPERGRAAAAAPRGPAAAARRPPAAAPVSLAVPAQQVVYGVAGGDRAVGRVQFFGRRPPGRQLFGRELRQRQHHHAAQGARRAAARVQGDGRRERCVARIRRPRRTRRMRRPVLNY